MVIESARKAASQLLNPRFRGVLLKSIGLTILLFFGAWIGLEYLFSTFLAPFLGGWPWVTTAILWLLSAGLFVGAGFLLAPVTALFVGIFLDEAAEYVEQAHYPADGPGKALPIGQSVWLTARFTLLVIFANLAALLLVLLPGINIAIFFLVNGYLLGREYFMFAAMRFRSEEEAAHLRSQYSTQILLAGFVIAGFMSVPILNLATPVFGAALMVHLHKALSGERHLTLIDES
ncbi:MAG: sulfate transporter family protein [Salaquimonas sp.]